MQIDEHNRHFASLTEEFGIPSVWLQETEAYAHMDIEDGPMHAWFIDFRDYSHAWITLDDANFEKSVWNIQQTCFGLADNLRQIRSRPLIPCGDKAFPFGKDSSTATSPLTSQPVSLKRQIGLSFAKKCQQFFFLVDLTLNRDLNVSLTLHKAHTSTKYTPCAHIADTSKQSHYKSQQAFTNIYNNYKLKLCKSPHIVYSAVIVVMIIMCLMIERK